MKRFITPAVLLSCLSLASFIGFSGLDGKWKGTFTPRDGHKIAFGCDFKTDNDKLTGGVHGGDGDHNIIEGKIKGDSLFFKIADEDGNIPVKSKYFVASDSISLVLIFSDANCPGMLKRVTDK